MGPHGESILRLVLRAGTIFYVQDRRLTSPEPHYFIVLNVTPLTDRHLILCVTSSQVEKVLRRCSSQPETAVLIHPADCPELARESIVNCNDVFTKSRPELADQVGRKEAVILGQLSAPLVEALRTGILASPTVVDEIKAMLRDA